VKVHLQIDGSPTGAKASAAEIAATGADGVFTFEGQHDVFFPLIIAGGDTSLDLMTNVAIAAPRSPLHLAHAAYDLQAYSGAGSGSDSARRSRFTSKSVTAVNGNGPRREWPRPSRRSRRSSQHGKDCPVGFSG